MVSLLLIAQGNAFAPCHHVDVGSKYYDIDHPSKDALVCHHKYVVVITDLYDLQHTNAQITFVIT